MSLADVSPNEPFEIAIYLNQFHGDPPLVFGDVTSLLKSYLHPATPFVTTGDEIWFWDDIIGDSWTLTDWVVCSLGENNPPVIIDLTFHSRIFWNEEIDEDMIIILTSISPIVNVSLYQKRRWLTRLLKNKLK